MKPVAEVPPAVRLLSRHPGFAPAGKPNRWAFAVRGGEGDAEVVYPEPWLSLRATPHAPAPARNPPAPDLLRSQAALAGGVKFASGAAGERWVRTELWLPSGSNRRRIDAALEDLAAGVALAAGRNAPERAAARPAAASSADAAAALERIGAEAGWVAHLRDDGTLLVQLEPADLGCTATVSASGTGGFRASVELLIPDEEPPAEVQAALSLCLLRLNATIRGARAGFASQPAPGTVVVEAEGADATSAAEVVARWSALSLACRLAAAETSALLDPENSREYLAVVGGEPTPTAEPNAERSITP